MIIFKDKFILNSIQTSHVTQNNNNQDMKISLYGLSSEIELKILSFDQQTFLNFRSIFNEHKDTNKKNNRILLNMYYGEEWNI
jgi:hypothetical protein